MKLYTNFISELLIPGIIEDPELKYKPITLFYDYIPSKPEELMENPINLLFIQEPNQLFGYHEWAIQNQQYFSGIFTWGDKILQNVEQSSLFLFGAGDLKVLNTYNKNKQFEISFLCGPKKMIEGHYLRHRIFDIKDKIQIPFNFIFKGDKNPCWNSMFHIAVENSKNKNYFTEKIVEAFLTKTIPLYWGCPNIKDFFNLDGIITFENEYELIDIVNNLTPEFYHSKKDIIEENYQTALQYADIVKRMNLTVKDICKLNNITDSVEFE